MPCSSANTGAKIVGFGKGTKWMIAGESIGSARDALSSSRRLDDLQNHFINSTSKAGGTINMKRIGTALLLTTALVAINGGHSSAAWAGSADAPPADTPRDPHSHTWR